MFYLVETDRYSHDVHQDSPVFIVKAETMKEAIVKTEQKKKNHEVTDIDKIFADGYIA